MLLCAVEVLSFPFYFFFSFFLNYHIQAVFLCNFPYGPQEKKNRKKQSQLFGYRVEPITTLVSCVASHPSVLVLGSSDMAPRDRAAVPIQGQGLAPLKQDQNFTNAAVICASLNLLCLFVYSGLIPLLCLY